MEMVKGEKTSYNSGKYDDDKHRQRKREDREQNFAK